MEYILRAIAYPKDLAGKKILVTAGPTRKLSIRCATSRTIQPEKWDTPWHGWQCCAVLM